MPKIILKDAVVVVNSVDLSDHVISVEINHEAEQEDDSAMGMDTRSNLAALKNWSINVEFQQDYAASKVDATLFPLVGAAAFVISVKPTSAAASATNPNYQGDAVLSSYGNPVGGGVGELAKAPTVFLPASTGPNTNPDLQRLTS